MEETRTCKICGYEGKEVWITNNTCDICNKWLFDLNIRFSQNQLKEIGMM